MSSEIAIRVRGLSKCYPIFDRPQDRLKQMLVRGRRKYYRDFWAVRDIDLDVYRGETVGIIGRNGSGKSTLLQLICGTLMPTSGSVEVSGRTAALLELGSGFNPDFTGRENVYMNGAILGLHNEEIDARFDDIAAFADIGDFIDQPIKTYSSGMHVRLAFAVAVCVDPDILVVDEALAVGDEAFQRKCFARIEQIQERGGTILFVSHSLQTVVQLCLRAMLFERGELLLEGRPRHVTAQYQRLVNASPEAALRISEEIKSPAAPQTGDPTAALNPVTDNGSVEVNSEATAANSNEEIGGYDPNLVPQTTLELETRGARIRDVRILTLSGEQVNLLQLGRRYVYEYFVDFSGEATDVGFGMFIRTVEGFGLGGAQTIYSRTLRTKRVTRNTIAHVQFEFSCSMLPGTYFCTCGLSGTLNNERIVLHRTIDAVMFKVAPEPDLIAIGRIDIGALPRVRIIAGQGGAETLSFQDSVGAGKPHSRLPERK
jgi:lipopolysaccharide transport system ATP-binding protein